ncbi:uncharacterized protein LOC114724297 isoform X2 [Neltuma alba]|uniref:uncharacterized protein LOC114724297 isoform X2 n=1 Tax=Neltuma alba TaxID=207710 RepID=UPI0010A37F28|nr:uncharacterized protein LOC114724297 isoform X2 [Prosopis alba]
MAPPDREVLQALVDVGDGLLNHPSSSDQLLALLDKLENILSTLDQEPDETVKEAILPSMKALISGELLRHSDEHVKISVASCIAEITRITAPDAPYGDEHMKEIFKLTVEAFEKLSDVPSRSYDKALLIVDNVARVRSCLLMMDLECDDLIVQMFQIFLRVVRPNHPEVVTFAIEAIMTMVLNESEEISADLLRTILDGLRKENEAISPISWSLAEKVITNCAAKLQPYVMRAVQSTGRPLDAFGEIVVSICQRGSETLQCNHSNGSGDPLVQAGENELSVCKSADEQYCDDQEPDMTCARRVAQTMDDSKLNKRNPSSTVDSETIKRKSAKRQPYSDLTKNEKRKNTKTNLENGNSRSVEKSSSEAELDVMPKKRGHRPNSLMNPEEGYDHSQICMNSKSAKAVKLQKASNGGCYFPTENVGEVSQPKTGKTIKHKKACDRGAGLPPSKSSASQEDKLLLEPKSTGELSLRKTNKKSTKTSQGRKACDSDIELSPPANHDLLKDPVLKKSENKGCKALVSQRETDKNIDAAQPSTDQRTPDKSHRKRGRPRKNSITNNQGADPRSVSMTKEDHLIAQNEDVSLEPASLRSERDLEVMKEAEMKNQAPLRKIKVASKTDENTAVNTESVVDDIIGKPGEDEKATPVMNIETTNTEEDQALTQTSVKRRRKLDAPPNKDVNGSCTIKQLTESLGKKLTGAEETPQTKRRRKRTTVSVEASEIHDCNEPSVGSRIKVWWPMDKRFYEGVVDFYDPAKGKHKILYADGDVEVLNLKKQRWELITDHASPDADREIGLQQIETVTSDTEDKGKGNSAPESAKGAKASCCRTRGRASARISKSESVKPARKSKDDSVVDEPAVAHESAVTKNEQDSAGKSKNRRLKILSDQKMTKPKDSSALDEPTVAGETAVDPPRTENEQDSAGKSKAKRLTVASDKKKIKHRDGSPLDVPIEADESAVDPPQTKNEQESAGKRKTKRSKILSGRRKIEPKDNSAPDEPIEADDSAVDPPQTENEQESTGKSKSKRSKILSDKRKIEPKDNSALDEPIEADRSAVDPPRTKNEQDSTRSSKTKRSNILSDKKMIEPKDNSALDETIEIDDSAVDLPRTKNEQESTGKSITKRSKILSDERKIGPKDNSALDEPIEAGESAVDPSRTKNGQESAVKSRTKRLRILSDEEKIEPRDNSALDEPIEPDDFAVGPPRTKNEQDSTRNPKTKRSKILSDKEKSEPKDNSALDELVEVGDSAVDPPRTKNEQDSTGKSKTQRSKILSDRKMTKPRDNSALDDPIEADDSAVDPPRTKNEQDSAGKFKTRRSKILPAKKQIEPKDNPVLDEPIVADESTVDPPQTSNDQESAGKSKTRRSKTLSDKKKIEPIDNSALHEPIVADESAVDPPQTNNDQELAGKSKTRRLKILSDKKKIESKDNSAFDEPIVVNESAVDPPRTNDEQDSAGKSKTKRVTVVSDKKKIRPRDDSALDEPIEVDEAAVDPPQTNNEQESVGRPKTRRLKIVSGMKKIEPDTENVQKAKLRKA